MLHVDLIEAFNTTASGLDGDDWVEERDGVGSEGIRLMSGGKGAHTGASTPPHATLPITDQRTYRHRNDTMTDNTTPTDYGHVARNTYA
jgi:hypothetical protein